MYMHFECPWLYIMPVGHDRGTSSAMRSWIADYSENPRTARTLAASFFVMINFWMRDCCFVVVQKFWVTPEVHTASNLFSNVGGFPFKSDASHLSHLRGWVGVPKITANFATSKALLGSKRPFVIADIESIQDNT